MSRRCGVTGPNEAGEPNALGCCRAEHPGELHCAHPGEQLTGTPGRVVVAESWLGRSYADCDGTAHPAADRIVHSTRPGDVQSRFELIPPDRRSTP